MADLSDIENALVALVVSALYPNGTDKDSAVGATCRIYRGWPVPAALNSDLASGVVNVTVFPAVSRDEVLPRYLDNVATMRQPVGLSVSVSGTTVAFGGQPGANEVAGILIDNIPYVYVLNAGDTASIVAASLAALIAADRPATCAGDTLTAPGASSVTARVVSRAASIQMIRRTRRDIQISAWCPSPLLRDSISTTVDTSLAGLTFIPIDDGTQARLVYLSTQVYDQSQNASLYRRDLVYQCEYTMITSVTSPTMLFGCLVDDGSVSYS
jgi:hypothetical protein